MYNEWSLNVLYKGLDDEAFQNDVERVASAIAAYKKAVAELDHENEVGTLRRCVDAHEAMGLLVRRLFSYLSLRRSANSADKEGASYQTRLQMLLTETAKEGVQFKKFVGEIEDLDAVLSADPVLSEYRFYFGEIVESVRHTMSDECEALFARMNLSGGKAWSDLTSFLTAGLEVEYDGKVTTLPAIRALAESDSQEVRKAAYEAEIASYAKVKDAIAFSLNSIKAQVNLEATLRGYENPLAMTLADSRMEKATLDAMFEAMREFMPKFRAYLKHKAKLLGYENGLPWYEILAPMGKADSKTIRQRRRTHISWSISKPSLPILPRWWIPPLRMNGSISSRERARWAARSVRICRLSKKAAF